MTAQIYGLSATQSALLHNGSTAIIFDQNGIVSGIGKNKLINSLGLINQRGVSGTVTLAAGAYGHDRFKAGAAGCTYTFATIQNVTTLTISAGTLVQVVEGLNLQSGPVVLGWTGTSQGRIDTSAYGASGITGTAIGGTNMVVEFGVGTVSLPQLEPWSKSSYFEQRHYGIELTLCHRYCQVCSPSTGFAAGTTTFTSTFNLFTPMRAVPTATLTGVYTINNGSANITQSSSNITISGNPSRLQASMGNFAGLTANGVYCTEPGSSSILLSAEL